MSLSAATSQTVTVKYATANGTAVASTDYSVKSGSLSFSPGQTSKTITMTIVGDSTDEPDESFFVNLTAPTNATISDGQAQVTIFDNDAPPSLTISSVFATEATGTTVNAIFTVKLSAVSGFAVTVNFATADGSALAGSDYNSASGSLTFNPGETTKTITVSILGDSDKELTETFSLKLSNALNAVFANSDGIGTILDND